MQQQARPKQEIWFQKEIRELLKQEKASPPPQGAIVFTGSSIFRFWVTLARDMSPMPVVNRAFGGARTWELLHYMDKIILLCKPSIIACYCGGNDIEFGSPAEDIALRFRHFCERVHATLPETRIFFISLNKAPQKIEKWREIDLLNSLVQSYSRSENKIGCIDINPVFFNAQGQPRHELYISDGLHFMPDAYKGITKIIKPVLEQAWQQRQGQP
ncbi:MAG: GDSL-type esterase/lipase family protein [Proteobacteria bacterium]|nr:GDSL-type esterase/lipase family protein [Pseudomonadota bacterium]